MSWKLGLILACASGAGSAAWAAPIEFTYGGTAQGRLNGVLFGASSFTISAWGETDSRRVLHGGDGPEGYSIEHQSARIEIAGLGLIHFVSPTRTFVNNQMGVMGFSRGGEAGIDLYDGPTSDAFRAWDMTRSVGPVSGTAELWSWLSPPVFTDRGILYLFNDLSVAGTFSATVPAPGAGALAGLCVCVLVRRRR